MSVDGNPPGPAQTELGLEAPLPLNGEPRKWRLSQIRAWVTPDESLARYAFVLPALLALLFLSLFPLVVSLYLSLSRFTIARGGFALNFVGFANYGKLLWGNERTHFLGLFAPDTPQRWLVSGVVVVSLVGGLLRYLWRPPLSLGSALGRGGLAAGLGALAWLLVNTWGGGGRLGTLSVTLVYVFVGIFFQYLLGLGLAVLTVQQLPGRRFFRTVFLLPMMITPVGVAYMFRMVTDTSKGPFTPVWQALGLGSFSWATDPWGARTAILIADIWQWTPFIFIVLVAALKSQPLEPLEAAVVDGANGWQIFRYITWPGILPVSLTLILIRLIEAFKIVDLPNVMTNGGPGTATESLTLQAFILWRNLDLGGSAAVAYLLLFSVTFFSLVFVNLIRQRIVEQL